MALAARSQFLLQPDHVLRAAHEREADDIGVFDDKIEIEPVFFGHGADAEIGVREVDAFGRAQFRFRRAGMQNLDQHMLGMHFANAPFDLAVVEEDRLAWFSA